MLMPLYCKKVSYAWYALAYVRNERYAYGINDDKIHVSGTYTKIYCTLNFNILQTACWQCLKNMQVVEKSTLPLFISSPEHNVLGVSYCDRPVSGVSRPSSVMRRSQFASNDISSVITGQISTKVDKIVPLEVLYQNCSNRSAPLQKMAARDKNRKSFKRDLLQGQWPDFKIISQKCSFGDPL